MISKARNRLAPSRSIKLVYIKSNHRVISHNILPVKLPTTSISQLQVTNFLRDNRTPHRDFPHPTLDVGANLCSWTDPEPISDSDSDDDTEDALAELDEDGDGSESRDADDVCNAPQFDYDGEADVHCPSFLADSAAMRVRMPQTVAWVRMIQLGGWVACMCGRRW
eukprot:SAG25_NODE_3213_length_1170_cov_10.015760_3_plen_166_part_00